MFSSNKFRCRVKLSVQTLSHFPELNDESQMFFVIKKNIHLLYQYRIFKSRTKWMDYFFFDQIVFSELTPKIQKKWTPTKTTQINRTRTDKVQFKFIENTTCGDPENSSVIKKTKWRFRWTNNIEILGVWSYQSEWLYVKNFKH